MPSPASQPELPSPQAPGPRLLADVGGTNARFAWQAGPGAELQGLQTLACADHASLADAARHCLRLQGFGAPAGAAVAIATSVHGDQVAMTNHHWAFSVSALKAALGVQRLVVLNDFTALALALPQLAQDERRQVGGGAAVAQAPLAVLGPGTGLGVSGLLPDGRGGWLPIQGEGGHATLAATTPREHAVLQVLARRHGHVSAERAVCGQGLVDLHRAVLALDRPGQPVPDWDAADITARALAQPTAARDPACAEALDLMCAFLGTVAGNLALTLGARGGVYIGGGIVPRLGAAFDASPFRARFEAKGRFSRWLADLPVYVVEARRSPALLGAAHALDAPLRVVGWGA